MATCRPAIDERRSLQGSADESCQSSAPAGVSDPFESTKRLVYFVNFNKPDSRDLLRELNWDISEYRREVENPNGGE